MAYPSIVLTRADIKGICRCAKVPLLPSFSTSTPLQLFSANCQYIQEHIAKFLMCFWDGAIFFLLVVSHKLVKLYKLVKPP